MGGSFPPAHALAKGQASKSQGSALISLKVEKDLKGLLFSHQVVSDSVPPRTAARPASLSFTISQTLLKLMSTESVM